MPIRGSRANSSSGWTRRVWMLLDRIRHIASKASPTTVGFAVPAFIAVVISLVVTGGRTTGLLTPSPKRFSGSTVVAPMSTLLRPSRLPERVTVAIVRDEAAIDFYNSPATLDTILRAWRDALTAVGAD